MPDVKVEPRVELHVVCIVRKMATELSLPMQKGITHTANDFMLSRIKDIPLSLVQDAGPQRHWKSLNFFFSTI